MLRTLLGAIFGVVAWMVLAVGLGFLLGQFWPALAEASRDPAILTPPMLLARLGVSFVASLLSGAMAARVARDGIAAALASGILLLAAWGYYHVTMIWSQFPVWYHLTFLTSLPALSVIGARLAPPRVAA